ncbi:metallophosphoesterase family protein [Rhabdothermincola salaria]|uniref:metallophosphoesterase family protein n=1 Tax=Rhabdothermincola salaria TaxID=2903142 RepID=UPI001E63F29D|nr:exonuclease subunit SbcD [Rhabdothermincola salaria]
MRFLHTADWHVGKTIRGRSRTDEHEAVLGNLVELADTEDVDLVVVVGDLFDSAAPSPEAERIVYRTLLDLGRGGRPVVVVSGNHDNPRRLAAVAPVFDHSHVHLHTTVVPPDQGGVLALEAGGVPVRLALLPFVSQRHVVGVDELMGSAADQHALAYADRMARILEVLASGFEDHTVNIVVAHAMVAGAVTGGGERSAHTIFEYALPSVAFPASAHYVALGHLHRGQQIHGPCPIWYPGSPLALDFGEQHDLKGALLVEALPRTPARVEPIALGGGRAFRTVTGTVAELAQQVRDGDDSFVRVVVREPGRAGLADEVRALFPEAIEIRVEPPDGLAGPRPDDDLLAERTTPRQQFAGYLAARAIDDPRLVALFDELHDDAVRAERDEALDAP